MPTITATVECDVPSSFRVEQVAGMFDLPRAEKCRETFMLLRDVRRLRVGFDGLCRALREVYAAWRPARILIEQEKLGQAACDVLHSEMPIECIATGGKDKVARAALLINKLERGEVFLPKFDNDWLPELESEWLSWTGLPDETADQIDAAAYAAIEASRTAGGVLQIQPVFVR